MKITSSAAFGKAIQKRRKDLKYTQEYISEVTGLSASFISNLEAWISISVSGDSDGEIYE